MYLNLLLNIRNIEKGAKKKIQEPYGDSCAKFN